MGTVGITVQIDVVGHASARWRGASRSEAAERNQELSIKRALAVGNFMEQVFKKELFDATLILTGTGLPRPKGPISGMMMGVGSSKPIVVENSTGNNAINRSVFATVRVIRKTQTYAVKHRTVSLWARSQYWGLEILSFDAAALAVGSGHIRFRLTNGATNKTRRYEAALRGIGLDNPLSDFKDSMKDPMKEKAPKPTPEDPRPDQIWFETGKPIGFANFDVAPGKNIRVWKFKAGVGLPKINIGVATSYTELGFDGLGGTSDSIGIDSSVELSGLTVSGYRMSGEIKPLDPHPGDYADIGIESYDENLPPSVSASGNGIVVLFATGDGNLSDGNQTYIRDWARNWARNLNILAKV